MTHPTNIPDFQAALGALTPGDVPEGAVDAIAAAQMAISVVPQCGAVLDALRDHHATLELEAVRVLAGAAHLMLVNGFLGRAQEADGVRDQARARIAVLDG